jgi:hypothetical protein
VEGFIGMLWKKNVISLNKLFHRVYVGCVLRQIILAELICCHCTYKKKIVVTVVERHENVLKCISNSEYLDN